jgi:hypothetical protein
VPPPEGGEIAAAQKVLAGLFQRARSSIERAAERSAAVGQVLTEWRAALDDQVGSDTWRRFLDYSRKQRTSNFGLENGRPREVVPDRIATARKEARERSLELLDEANVRRDAVRAVHARAQEKLLRSLGPPDTGVPRLEVVREEQVPTAVREGRTNPWFAKTPPYDGWYWNFGWQTWGGTVTSFKHNIGILYGLQYPSGSYINGQFGHYSLYENFDASDFDVLWLNGVSEVGFWYKAPEPGQRQVWVKIRCKKARGDIYLDEEYGWSDSATSMLSRLYLNVWPVPGLEGQTGDWYAKVKGSPDSKWYHLDWIAPETVLWVPFVANFPPDWVYIAVGADDYRWTQLNDVSTTQAMDSRYLAEGVWIQH